MPIYWRYLLSQYFRSLLLSVLAFILLLVISRLHETASFASLGAPLSSLFYFLLYQFPYILPIAIPVSCLLSSFLMAQRLSKSSELIAFRALGKSLFSIILPLLTASILLSFLNFYIASEIATSSHLASKQLVQELSSLNPLVLLKNKNVLKRKDAFVKARSTKAGREASDVVIAIHQKDSPRISLFFAKKFALIDTYLKGSYVSFISSAQVPDDFDHLIIENQKEMETPASEFTSLVKKSATRICPDHLKMRLLLSKLILEKKALKNIKENMNSSQDESLKKFLKTSRSIIQQCYSELARRVHVGIAPFVFTLMGISFGIEIGRKKSKKGLIVVSTLAALSFAAFFLAKGLSNYAVLASIIYLFPAIAIILLSISALKRVQKGVE